MEETAKQELIRLLRTYIESLPMMDRVRVGSNIAMCPCALCNAGRDLLAIARIK